MNLAVPTPAVSAVAAIADTGRADAQWALSREGRRMDIHSVTRPEEGHAGVGNPGKTLTAHYDMRSQAQSIIAAAKHGPLQTLTDRELALREQPVTVYPHALQRRVTAWVRFGAESIRVDARLLRTTPKAAGIEFRAGDQKFRCWVWGNAVEIVDDA